MKYKIIKLLVLLLPISSFVLISAFTGQTYDGEIFTQNNAILEFYAYDEGFVVFSEQADYSGYLVPYNDTYALYIESGDVIKVGHDYYTEHEGAFVNVDTLPPQVEKTSNAVISITTVIAILVVALIIGGKMDLLKSHPKASVMVSLSLGTLILYGMSVVLGDILNVFVIATISWAMYLVVDLIEKGTLSNKEGEKIESALLTKLKEIINE